MRMHLSSEDKSRIGSGRVVVVKEPEEGRVDELRDPAVVAKVSEMLRAIEREGMDAVLRYARELDAYEGTALEIPEAELEKSGERIPEQVREALETGAERTRRFARMQRDRLHDFEEEVLPGVVCGQRFVPVQNVGAYLPAGRFPLLASAFMTVGVADVAGVPNIVSCTPPSLEGEPHPAVLYAAWVSGARKVHPLGGVQALAAMAFGLLDNDPADMVVGAGNAFVAEAKRQLYGRVGIDVLAGPPEVAVPSDESADAEMVAADLLGQAEHGPSSPANLTTTSERLGREVLAEIDRQLEGLSTRDIAGAAWRDYGSIYGTESRESAVEVMDTLAPEHLEVLAEDLDWWLGALHNYGSLFLGTWSTVVYADKGMSGTNHVLPTARGARYTAGLSVTGYLKQLTYQKATREATRPQAGPVVTIADFEGMPGHRDSAQLRLDLTAAD